MKKLSILLGVAGVGLTAAAWAASPDAAKSGELVTLVRTSTDVAARARALQQLALVGTRDAVPVLAGLLADEQLSQYARDALEQMPDPVAGDALRAALGGLQGKFLIGVVNSLGVRRDPKAAEALATMARGADDKVAAAALLALGRIGTTEATRVVEAALGAQSADRRAAAAEAAILAAERLIKESQTPAARGMFEKVRQANVPSAWKVTATRWIILTGGARELPLLLEKLRSEEPDMRDMALAAARELEGPTVTPALIAEMDKLAPPQQAAVISVLVDRREAAALAAVEARAKTGVAQVRVAAIKALGAIGRDSSLPVLLQALQPPTSPEVAEAAYASLTRIPVSAADGAILKSLSNVDAALAARLIGVLGDRRAQGATGELLKLAAGTNLELAKAALRALGLVASPADLPRLIELATAVSDETAKSLADRAIVTTAMKVLEPERRAEAVVRALLYAKDPGTRAALLRPLGAIMRTMGPSHEVFFVVRGMLKDPAEGVRAAAWQCLADWPDATPTMVLLEEAERKDVSSARREVVLRGAVRMVANVAAGRERSPLNVLDAFTRANRAARSKEEKMMVVAGLGSLRRIESVQLLQPHLDDPAVAAEAALAIVQVAPALGGPKNTGVIKPLLERIAATTKDEEIRSQAARLAKGGGPSAPKGKAAKAGALASAPAGGLLFNGKDLGNWEGDPAVWRVRDGVIVGGSLLGNPRNEFLASTRRYRNFVLRLEYRLVGTEGFVNGGVQIRSVRVAQPPNEMSGYQADIGAGYSGSLYDESRRKKFLSQASADLVKRLEKPGEWNRYEIRCEGPRVELRLNGENTVSYTEKDAGIQPDGLIALQIHGNCKAEIAFRNLEISELP